MSDELVRLPGHATSAVAVELTDLLADAAETATRARSANTLRAYAGDWQRFVAWCESRGICACPAEPAAVAAYMMQLSRDGRRWSTIERALASIGRAHEQAGVEMPTRAPAVIDVAKGLRRTIARAPKRVAAVTPSLLREACAALGGDLTGLRNRALLLLGFAGAFRRSELVALEVDALRFETDGVVVTLRRSKTDQEAKGQEKAIPFGSTPATCPVRTLREWLQVSGISTGPLFRDVRGGCIKDAALSDRTVARVVKAAARVAGLDEAEFSGHSLRAGLVTTAARAGKSIASIQQTTGHRSVQTLIGYVRRANIFDDCAAAGIGL